MLSLTRSAISSVLNGSSRSSTLNRCLSASAIRWGKGEGSEKGRRATSQSETMLEIGTREIFNADHDIFRESVRRFFREEVLPKQEEWEERGDIGRETWERAGSLGLLGVSTPVQVGGHGGTFLDSAIVHEEQCVSSLSASTCKGKTHFIFTFAVPRSTFDRFSTDRSYVNSSGPGFPLHTDIVMPYITHYGTPEQIQRLIPDMMAGKRIGAIAMTEPGAGSDLQGIRTHAKKDGDDWILNGSKTFITNGWLADTIIVVAVTKPDAKSAAHGISLFVVEEGMLGFKKGRKLKKMGLTAQVREGKLKEMWFGAQVREMGGKKETIRD
ncbi:unnamed protein product [Darwinula stevensoni]|uniref:Acyl-CoA dehydrogenase n=1 Tax=Darwinula stevensoni TaxID=69355 RepID=A0A7R8X836_9CRUS|nr:unnamed protein product [Darwinula stevensoni]CAG0889730.1 unnamed protein product [Darwinula stevensoni]